jgi:CubicO group peptidase (beta-lactamase class C family)
MAPAVRYLAALAAVLLGAVAADAGTTGLNGSPQAGQAATASHAQATAMLAPAGAAAAELDRIRSLLVSWRGSLVLERYYNGARAATPANIKSAAKSVISALVGIAIARGDIPSVRQPLVGLLPDEPAFRSDPRKQRITVEDLLSMRAGLEPTSFGSYGAWVSSPNWVRDALRRPMVDDPGGRMLYSTGSTHLLSAALTRATGTSTYAYALRHLARPLGIDLRPWTRDPQGIYFGGNDMYLTPREMARFGQLYLDGGVANGRRVLPQAWIDSSWAVRTYSPWNGHGYGYGWWTRTSRGRPVHFAWGYGGQFVFVVPSLRLVVVTTSESEAPREGDHLGAVHGLLDRIVEAYD